MLAQGQVTEARLALLVTLFNWRTAWETPVQVEMLEIANFFNIVLSLVCLVPVDQLQSDLWCRL